MTKQNIEKIKAQLFEEARDPENIGTCLKLAAILKKEKEDLNFFGDDKTSLLTIVVLAGNNNSTLLDFLLSSGAKPYANDELPALAAVMGSYKLLEVLHKREISVTAPCASAKNHTPLQILENELGLERNQNPKELKHVSNDFIKSVMFLRSVTNEVAEEVDVAAPSNARDPRDITSLFRMTCSSPTVYSALREKVRGLELVSPDLS